MFEDISEDQRSMLLMGLGARLLQAAGAGQNVPQGIGGALLGTMGDLGSLTQQAAANKRANLINQQLQKSMEIQQKREAGMERAAAKITGAERGLYSQPSQMVPSDMMMPGAAYRPAQAPMGAGLGRELIGMGLEYGAPEVLGLGKALMPQPAKPTTLQQDVAAMGLTPGTPEYQQAIRDIKMKPETVISMGEKLPADHRWKDPNRPELGVEPIPGGPAEKAAIETAAKKASIDVAKSQLPTIDELLFKDGEINRGILAQAAASKYVPGMAVPQGSQLANAYEYGIQAITRNETGAAMQQSELANTRKRFQPATLDSDAVIYQKRIAYELFLNNATKYIDPSASKPGKPAIDFEKLMKDAGTINQPPPPPGFRARP